MLRFNPRNDLGCLRADVDLDDAWGSETFISSAEDVKGGVTHAAEGVMGSSIEDHQQPAKAPVRKVLELCCSSPEQLGHRHAKQCRALMACCVLVSPFR